MRSARRAWLAYKRLTELAFPRRFPIVQFPNPPLIVALLAAGAGRLVHGTAHAFSTAVFWVAITIWALEELFQGANWFRRLLGLAFLISGALAAFAAFG